MDKLTPLVKRAQTGDLGAYDTIVRRFQDMAVGYAYTVLGDFHLAEDAAQEAFIAAYLDLPKLRKPEVFPGWFRKTVFKYCDRLTRRKQVQTVPLEAAAGLASGQKTPDEILEANQVKDRVSAALRALPEPERTATALFYIGGYSQAEIGAFLEIPVTTVKNRLRAARNRLKERMLGMVQENLHEQRPSRDNAFASGVMDDLIPLTDQEIQKILNEASVSLKDLAIALKGTTETLQARFFQNMSKRLGTMIREEMAFPGRASKKDIQAVHAEILQAAQKLHQEGQIAWPPEEPPESKPKQPDAEYLAAQRKIEETLQSTLISQLSFDEITEIIAHFAQRARREGVLLAFQDTVETARDEVLRQNIQMVVDGVGLERKKPLLEPLTRTVLQHYETRYWMIYEGLTAIRNEAHPRIVEQKLRMFYAPAKKERDTCTEASLDTLKARLLETPFSQLGFDGVAEALTDISIIARTEQLPALKNIAGAIDENLLVQGLELAAEGVAPDILRDILERRIQTLRHRHQTQYEMIFEGITAIQYGNHPRIIEQKMRSFYE